MLELYQPGNSPLHRLAPGWKILSLAVAGSLLFAVDTLVFSGAVVLVTLTLYRFAELPLSRAWAQLRPALWVFALILLAQVLFNDWWLGVLAITRFAALLMLAGLLTLTTRASEMIDGLETAFVPLRRLGLQTERVSLAISLTLRFIPVLVDVVQEVREAQRARGLERNFFALAIPALVRTLRMSEDVSDAIEARGF